MGAGLKGMAHERSRRLLRDGAGIRDRSLVGQGNDAIDGLERQSRDARGAGLVAGEPLDPLTHEALLPAPDHGFTLVELSQSLRSGSNSRLEKMDPTQITPETA